MRVVNTVDEPRVPWSGIDADRVVDLNDDEFVVLPDQTLDDTDRGWGEYPATNDDRLLTERPPHWD